MSQQQAVVNKQQKTRSSLNISRDFNFALQFYANSTPLAHRHFMHPSVGIYGRQLQAREPGKLDFITVGSVTDALEL